MLSRLKNRAYRVYKNLLPQNQDGLTRLHVHTQVMHNWLEADMARCSGEVGLDVGAGSLANRPLFKTRRYVAVEPNAESAATGRQRFPEAEIYVCGIEDFEPDAPIDVAMACTVIGNKHFRPESVMPTIRRVTQWLRPGGVFLFDVRPRVISYEPEVDEFVRAAFDRVDKRIYGRFDYTTPPFISTRVARMLSPRLEWNIPRDPARRRLYYACFGKR
jgi:SAM-dependent methyltransferase